MEEVVVTPIEVLGVVRHSFECDLGVCGGRHNVNYMHTEECSASTSGRERIDSPSGSSDGVCSRTDVCFEGNGDSAAEPSEMDPDSGHCSRTSVRGDDVVCFKKDHVELGRSFQMAISVHDWTLAESLVPLADPQRLNDGFGVS